ncbi:WD40 repeat-like protein [Rhizodiscina lignyota]|uniref:WD40 repeat-like protein n=1 Tax=Rhizodiscina lignyota TaxID=1504668 RepID=A0A9P4I8X6_9PEZI|nr:WD40 repeat-like protein [Rhizodiscina lignyota]
MQSIPWSSLFVLGIPTNHVADPLDPQNQYEDPHMEQKIINEEYKIWKKNSVFLYDMLYARALEWPTLTTQWLPDCRPIEGTNLREHRLLYGTNTSDGAQNYLQIAAVEIPQLYRTEPDPKDYNDQTDEIGGHGAEQRPFQFRAIQRINHPGEVNKARYMPQNPNIIASMCPDARVLVFDRTKHTLKPDNSNVRPEIELKGHKKEGFAMSWSWMNEGKLVTGAEDNKIHVWDIVAGFKTDNRTISPTYTWSYFNSKVNDVQHHPQHAFYIGAVSDDYTFQIIDTRLAHKPTSRYSTQAHTDAVNALAFHPKYDFLAATASADNTVATWDLRMFENKVHSFEGHRDDVIKLEWHPTLPNILASGSYDRRILMWNLNDIGAEQSEEEAEDGPPELHFMHGGFTNRICDFTWNQHDPWVMLAAAEDNQVQVFRPARKVVELPKRRVPNREVEE